MAASDRLNKTASLAEVIPMAGSEQRTCQAHGEYTARGFRLGGGLRWSGCPACHAEQVHRDEQAELQRLAQERAQLAAERRTRQTAEMLGRAMIPPRFADCTLESYQVEHEGQAAAKRRAQRYVDNWPDNLANGTCLILCGNPGTGKTHLAIGIARAVMDQGSTALFARVYELADAVWETYQRGAERREREVLAEFASPDLLVLDEVGRQKGSEAERLLLFKVINARYEQCKPTILISNQDLEGLRDYLDDATEDRLRQGGGKAIPFDWQSMRSRL